MAAGWMKSMQCKSRAYDDVISCSNSYQNLKDVVTVDPSKPKLKPKSKPEPKTKPKVPRSDPFSSKANRSKSKPEKMSSLSSPGSRVRRTLSAPISKESGYLGRVGDGAVAPFFPSVTELPKEHPSRNVVEIIFHTRWGPTGFSGRVEMVFKVHNPARTSSQFEEYRDLVRLRAGPGSGSGPGARCVADGNEKMRFQCLEGGRGLGEAVAVCTYSGSGAAHESGGGGKGRRAMVVCRVIAGRVSKRVGLIDPNKCELGEYDSVSGENGELLVFDSRAVLPCFIVIYKL
ncbi:hypothetical protein vseg_016849 [Gypsophila vaccaria]